MSENAKLAVSDLPGRETATVLPMYGLCPQSETLTNYDYRHIALYTWLLVYAEDGATLDELAANVFRFDLTRNRDWAMQVTISHLCRARWVQDQRFPYLDME